MEEHNLNWKHWIDAQWKVDFLCDSVAGSQYLWQKKIKRNVLEDEQGFYNYARRACENGKNVK